MVWWAKAVEPSILDIEAEYRKITLTVVRTPPFSYPNAIASRIADVEQSTEQPADWHHCRLDGIRAGMV